jgi:hypothetical protein
MSLKNHFYYKRNIIPIKIINIVNIQIGEGIHLKQAFASDNINIIPIKIIIIAKMRIKNVII